MLAPKLADAAWRPLLYLVSANTVLLTADSNFVFRLHKTRVRQTVRQQTLHCTETDNATIAQHLYL